MNRRMKELITRKHGERAAPLARSPLPNEEVDEVPEIRDVSNALTLHPAREHGKMLLSVR